MKSKIVLLGLVLMASGAGEAQGQTKLRRPVKRRVIRPVARRAPSALAAYQKAMAKVKVPAAERVRAEGVFKKLPASAQVTAVSALDPAFARQVRYPVLKKQIVVRVPELRPRIPPAIAGMYPDEGLAGQWAVVSGSFLDGDCRVYMGAYERPTHLLVGLLLFEVPANTALGAKQITVKNVKTGLHSNHVDWKVVAPRGYRGHHGFKFPNFSTANVSWAIYRNYFGADEVEYADGTHRPAAQAWYDSKYKRIGAGGDCYGMSMRSIRCRLADWRGNYSAWWPGHRQDSVWDYEKVEPQICDSIRWDQGGQLSAQSAALINDRANNQTHQQLFTFVQNAIATHQASKQPMLGMWSDWGGHAVVAYKTTVSGADKKVWLWDNNKPYRETVVDDENSVAVVNGANFTYGNYDKAIAFRFDEMSYADPNLPATAAGNMGTLAAGLTVITCDDPKAIRNIVDEKGRSFFGKGARRIPNSSRFVPLTGGRMPADYPAIFLFGASAGKSLTVDLDAGAEVAVRSFSPGRVNTVVARKGKLRLAKLLRPDAAVEIIDPDSMRPKSVEMISVLKDRTERLFSVTPKGALGRETIGFSLEPKVGNGVVIRNGKSVEPAFDLRMENFSPKGVQRKTFPNLKVPKAREALFQVGDMNTLQRQSLKRGLKRPTLRKVRPIKR